MTSGTEKRQRDVTLTIRLTPEERALIDAAADRVGLTRAAMPDRPSWAPRRPVKSAGRQWSAGSSPGYSVSWAKSGAI